jgi:hypothetical protein
VWGVVAAGGLLSSGDASAQLRPRAIRNVDVQALANGVLSLMSFTVAPDVTTSSLQISNSATANPSVLMTQVRRRLHREPRDPDLPGRQRRLFTLRPRLRGVGWR